MRKLLIILIFTSCKSANIVTGSFNTYYIGVTSFFDNKYLSDKSYFLYNSANNISQNDLSYIDNLKAIEEILKTKGYRRITDTKKEKYQYKIEVNWDFSIPYKKNVPIPISSMMGKNIGVFQGEKNYNMQQLNISCRENISNNEIWKISAENYTSSNDQRYIIRILSYALKDFIEYNSLTKKYFYMDEDNADFNTYLISTYPELEKANNLNKLNTQNRFEDIKKSIGNPIDLDKFLIAENDFSLITNWNDAIAYSKEIGDGWRLPNKSELNFLFKNKNKIGGFKDNDYWSSTNFDNDGAWLQSFKTGNQNFYYKKTPLNIRFIKSK